jgi:hypothetical protein
MDPADDNAPRSAIAVTLSYALMNAAVVAAYLGIRWYGDMLSPRRSRPPRPAAPVRPPT